jgi:hypothetical protein
MTDEHGRAQAEALAAAWHEAGGRVEAETGTTGWLSADLACLDCPAEVRVTEGTTLRARVIHAATCPWWQRYQAGEVKGRVPCGTAVVHRGPTSVI